MRGYNFIELEHIFLPVASSASSSLVLTGTCQESYSRYPEFSILLVPRLPKRAKVPINLDFLKISMVGLVVAQASGFATGPLLVGPV